jgi:uncharacterized protein YgiM (DUF1202 family)
MNTDAMSEDWKTAIAHNQRSLKKGEEVEILETVRNFYGTFHHVKAEDGETFYIKPKSIDINN